MPSGKLFDEGQTLPRIIPDFAVIDVPPESDLVSIQKDGILRRQLSSFIEVKAELKENPKPKGEGTVKRITAQAADYASIIFSSRPLNVAVVGVVVYATKFRTAFFDRAGVIFSNEYDVIENLPVFVRVIYRLTRDMGLEELGQDPSVSLQDNHTFYQAEYPSFVIAMGRRDDTRRWTTSGPPIWVSLSLFGRSTCVWHAKGLHGECILKIAWRDEARKSESEIYQMITSHPGVAQFLDGGDVLFSSVSAVKVDIQGLRDKFGLKDSPTNNRVLHRVSISPTGLPLWEYETEKDFFLALRDAVAGA
jgi:Fungal protein kinase